MTRSPAKSREPAIAAVPAPVPAHGRGRGTRTWRHRLTPWTFLIVPLAFLVAFSYVPIANMFVYSFTDWDGISPDYNFTGFDNYTDIFTRRELFEVFLTSLYYLGASVVQIVLALYFATVLSFNLRFRNLFKGIIFFPYLINGVAIGFVFLYFFQPGGTFDTFLRVFGIGESHLWLGDPDLVNYSLSGVSVWRFLGLNFVLFLGGIQSIPNELYEAAEIDGANRRQMFRHIVAPMLRPLIGLSAILAISGSLSVFEIPYIMTGGAGNSETFVIQTVKLAFQFNKTGLASAAAVVLLVLILLVTWVQRRAIPDKRTEIT